MFKKSTLDSVILTLEINDLIEHTDDNEAFCCYPIGSEEHNLIGIQIEQKCK